MYKILGFEPSGLSFLQVMIFCTESFDSTTYKKLNPFDSKFGILYESLKVHKPLTETSPLFRPMFSTIYIYFSDKLIGLSGSNAHICMLCSIINTKCLFCYLLILSFHKACNVFTDQCGNT